MSTPQLLKEESQALVRWAQQIRTEAEDDFSAAQQLVRRMGAHWVDGVCEVGFWVPELFEIDIPPQRIYLEILTPQEKIDFDRPEQTIRFRRDRVNLMQDGNFLWGVIDGLTPGRRDQVGTFYWLVYQTRTEGWKNIADPLAASLPFGAFAPAELYDINGMLADRKDKDHFQNLNVAATADDGIPRLRAPVNMLEIHTNTATADGSLASLTEMYQTIGRKLENDEPLTAAEKTFIGYDAVQLMPIEPTIAPESDPYLFWQARDTGAYATTMTVTVRRPDTTNWGYDILIAGSPAPNSMVLGSKRPDELLDFIETMHNFPTGPIKVVFDIVYGHNDNQALALLNRFYFAGANMYGQNINYLQPVVRAVLLEMQRRKSNYGVDGIRVDGAQDFKYWVSETNALHHDNAYLGLMNDLVQEVDGVPYRPWMVFEDGRPWPRDDWELSSTYREVTKMYPNVVQWGPLTFAHNTPFLFTFWISKWWRIREVMEVGSHWISGCANHDTLRRGTQVDPAERINTYLGDSLPEILANAYDNTAANLFFYAFAPGVPMDFLNASHRAPWSFIRNTDNRYGVKVVSEEAFFLDWCVDAARFEASDAFPRLKEMGFSNLSELRRFVQALDNGVQVTDYYLDSIARLLDSLEPPLPLRPVTVEKLRSMGRAWMDDIHDYCNLSRWRDALDDDHTDLHLTIRNFRRTRPWLRQNLRDGDVFDYRHPTDGTVLFYGLRTSPDESEQILFVGNMEGAPCTVTPAELPIPHLAAEGWQPAPASPGVEAGRIISAVTLKNSEGVVFVRRVRQDADDVKQADETAAAAENADSTDA